MERYAEAPADVIDMVMDARFDTSGWMLCGSAPPAQSTRRVPLTKRLP